MKPYFLVPLALLIPFLITIQGSSSQNLINSTCLTSARDDPNIDYAFCTTSLQAAPASRCATIYGLGTISIRLVQYNLTDTRCYIKQLMKSRRWDPYVKQCLDDCFQLFSDAIPSVEKAMEYYKTMRYNDANVQLSAILDVPTTCEDGFKEKRGVVSPWTKRNDDVFQLSAIALSVIFMIQKDHGDGN